MTNRTNIWKVAVLAAALTLATGCHKKPVNTAGTGIDSAPSTEPAPTATLTADPPAIDLGQSVVLNWRTTNAASVAIDGIGPVPTSGTQTVSPANSTNFHLIAKGDGGTVEANVRVTVRVATAPATGESSSDLNGAMGTDAAFHQNVRDIFFDYDSFDLRPDAQTAAVNAARYLSAHPAIRVVIGGYCDDRGSAEYNITLGENRANAARTALISAGVPASRVRVVSYGKERQFCSEQNETCWQENRRAQFNLDR
ncbi:MAG: OmpA family protein [Acidobacteriota bacterium]|nr:OmpA family protein [Acidobacteriota bacterium]